MDKKHTYSSKKNDDLRMLVSSRDIQYCRSENSVI